MTKQLKPLMIIIVLLGAILYVGGIIHAGIQSINYMKIDQTKGPEIEDIET